MNSSTAKSVSLPNHHLILYKRALHPELFSLRARRTLHQGAYELEAWVMQGAHMIRFQHRAFAATELVTNQDDGLPTNGAVATFPCAGEKDYEHPFPEGGLRYLTTVQTETLPENLYNATYQEMLTLADETDALLHTWAMPEAQGGGKCLSMLELQRYNREIHAQSTHMQACQGFVLRTQTIFEVR